MWQGCPDLNGALVQMLGRWNVLECGGRDFFEGQGQAGRVPIPPGGQGRHCKFQRPLIVLWWLTEIRGLGSGGGSYVGVWRWGGGQKCSCWSVTPPLPASAQD